MGLDVPGPAPSSGFSPSTVIVTGIASLNLQEDGEAAEEVAKAERDLGDVQMEEERCIRLYVSGKITEDQLDHQRKFFTERLESLSAQVDDYRAQRATGTEKRALARRLAEWARIWAAAERFTSERSLDTLA